MSVWWSYFWPLIAAGLIIGAIGGSVAFRRRRQTLTLAAATALAVASAALWHGPLGAADRLTAVVERSARATLDYYEMTQVQGRLHRKPLTRRLMLSGPADDFQRGELVRLMSQLPGVSSASWSSRGGVPLIVESVASAVAGFLLGLLLAYLVELRRRYNAQWNW